MCGVCVAYGWRPKQCYINIIWQRVAIQLTAKQSSAALSCHPRHKVDHSRRNLAWMKLHKHSISRAQTNTAHTTTFIDPNINTSNIRTNEAYSPSQRTNCILHIIMPEIQSITYTLEYIDMRMQTSSYWAKPCKLFFFCFFRVWSSFIHGWVYLAI